MLIVVEPAEDDKTYEIEKCGQCITKDSLWLAKNFGQLEATCNQGQTFTIGYFGQPL